MMRSLVLVVVALSFVLTSTPALAAPQKSFDRFVESLESGSLEERIAGAQGLEGMGRRAAKATPVLLRTLAADEAPLVDASVSALVAIGGKARPSLESALQSGEFKGDVIPRGPIARTLMQMGNKGRKTVNLYVKSAEPGPELFTLFEEFGDEGPAYLISASQDAEHAADALRSLRRLAAREVRTIDTIETLVNPLKDADLKLAVTFSWTQDPNRRDVEVLRIWLKGQRPELVDTGLWCLGLLGSDANSAANEIVALVVADDPIIRHTALWALAGLATKGPSAPSTAVPASYPGASSKAGKGVTDATSDKIFAIWRDGGKPLGYRGRVGDKARALWSLAPSWTGQVDPLPSPPNRSTLPAPLIAAEAKVLDLARSGAADPERHVDAALASRVLTATGATSEAVIAMWIAWLSSDDANLRMEALLGLRAVGRGAITHEALIIGLLENDTTRVAAAQVLTAIATPTAWSAVVAEVASAEGKPPLALLKAISRYDTAALEPALDRFRELYHEGNYIMAAFLIRFGDQVVDDFVRELSSGLSDRRMVAAESLGHMGEAAKPALPALKKLSERSPISQQLVKDAIARIG